MITGGMIMKSKMAILLAIFGGQLLFAAESECFVVPNITWQDCKQFIKDNPQKVCWGIAVITAAALIVKQFNNQLNRILQNLTEVKREQQIILDTLTMYDLTKLEIKDEEVDTIAAILMRHDVNDIIAGLADFLGENWSVTQVIDIDKISDKIHICWHNPPDYGKSALYKLKALLWKCMNKYDCISELETHDKNLKLECILVPVRKKSK